MSTVDGPRAGAVALAERRDEALDGAAQSRRAARSGPAWFAVTVTLVVGLAPLLLIASTQPVGRSPWAWAWALAALVGLRYAWLVAEHAQRTFEIVFWLFAYAFMCLAPLVQLRTGTYPGTTPFIDTSLNGAALGVVALGLASFAVGNSLAGRATRSNHPVSAVRVLPDRLAVFTVFALLLAGAYVLRVGPTEFFGSRSARDLAEVAAFSNSTVRAVIKAAASLPLLVSFAGLVQVRRERQELGSHLSIAPQIVVLLTLFVVANPVSSPRYYSGTALLSILAVLGATATLGRARVFALILIAGLVLVFPYADLTRRASVDMAAVTAGGPSATLTSSDFDAFDQVNNSIAYVHEFGYTRVSQLGGAVLFFVPRTLWPTKPEDTGILLGKFRDAPTNNLSAPVWAEFFLAGGWAAVALGMAGLGWLIRRLDQNAVRRSVARLSAGPLNQILPFYAIIMLRGSLLQSMAGFSVLVFSGAFVSRRVRREL